MILRCAIFLFLVSLLPFPSGAFSQNPETSLHAGDRSRTLSLQKGVFRSFKVSPFDAQKVFFRHSYRREKGFECDFITGEVRELLPNGWEMAFLQHGLLHSSSNKTQLWIALPDSGLLLHDRLTQHSDTVSYARLAKLLPAEKELVFVSPQGIHIWKPQTQKLHRSAGLSLKKLRSAAFFLDNTLALSGKFAAGEAFRCYDGAHPVDRSWLMGPQFEAFFSASQHIFPLPETGHLQSRNYPPTKPLLVDPPFLLQRDGEHLRQFHLLTEQQTEIPTGFSRQRHLPERWISDKGFIWIQRMGNIYRLDQRTGRMEEVRMEAVEELLSFALRGECVYLMFKKRIEVVAKTEFLKRGRAFDAEKYAGELRDYYTAAKGAGLRKSRSDAELARKLKALRGEFGDYDHVEIGYALKRQDQRAYVFLRYNSAKQYMACFQDSLVPMGRRKNCILKAMRTTAQKGNFKEVMRQFEAYKDSGLDTTQLYYLHAVHTTSHYLYQLDSLDQMGLSPDSLAYYKAMALEPVIFTPFFQGEGCVPADDRIWVQALKAFQKKFPDSQLRDEAAFALAQRESVFHEIGEDYGGLLQIYERFLGRYPDSEKGVEAKYQIAYAYAGMCWQSEDKGVACARARKKIGEFVAQKPGEEWALHAKDLLGSLTQ